MISQIPQGESIMMDSEESTTTTHPATLQAREKCYYKEGDKGTLNPPK